MLFRSEYWFATFCVLPSGDRICADERRSPADPSSLALDAADFPAAFAHVVVEDRLWSVGDLGISVSWEGGGYDSGYDSGFDPGSRTTTLLAPRSALDARMTVNLTERDGSGSVQAALPFRTTSLDLPSFAGYGQHVQTATATFADVAASSIIVEVVDQAQSTTSSFVCLSPAAPTASFSWFAASPFEPGYRYRRGGESRWSEPMDPSAPLRLAAVVPAVTS